MRRRRIKYPNKILRKIKIKIKIKMNATSDMELEDLTENVTPSPQNDAASGYLALARQFVDQGKPSEALQAVVMAMRTKGGEEAVYYIFQRARELYRSKLQTSAVADQLASLFAECAIAEAHPTGSEPSPSSPLPSFSTSATPPTIPVPSFSTSATLPSVPAHELVSDARGKSILAESGRKQIVLDAFSDGSSFICLQCGGLVSKHRKDVHYAYWCQI